MIPPMSEEEKNMIDRMLGAPPLYHHVNSTERDLRRMDLFIEEIEDAYNDIDVRLTRVLDPHKESGDPKKEERFCDSEEEKTVGKKTTTTRCS